MTSRPSWWTSGREARRRRVRAASSRCAWGASPSSGRGVWGGSVRDNPGRQQVNTGRRAIMGRRRVITGRQYRASSKHAAAASKNGAEASNIKDVTWYAGPGRCRACCSDREGFIRGGRARGCSGCMVWCVSKENTCFLRHRSAKLNLCCLSLLVDWSKINWAIAV